jgi:cell division protein FtsZ
MIELQLEEEKPESLGAKLKVIGVGGAGGNAVNSMIEADDLASVEFIVANTDAQSLSLSSAECKIQLGKKVTKGLGAGSNPDIGRRAAEEDIEDVITHIEDADILFLTAGLGGGTGSGALPVIAQMAQERGILSIAIVTKPFLFEGKRRMEHAEEAIRVLKQTVDTVIIVPNQKLLEIVDPKISMLDAFALSNSILKQAIKGISDIITYPGHINVDFADVRSVMKDMGMALMGTGRQEGEHRAKNAALKAISSQLLEDVNIQGARGVLINITGNTDLGLHEINEAASVVSEMVSEDANIILGSVIDPEMGNDIMVTVIATGFEPASNRSSKEASYSFTEPEKESDAPNLESQVSVLQESEMLDQQTVVDGVEDEDTQIQATPAVQDQEDVQIQTDVSDEQHEVTTTVSVGSPTLSSDSFDLDDLDTPAFLRKKVESKNNNEKEF